MTQVGAIVFPHHEDLIFWAGLALISLCFAGLVLMLLFPAKEQSAAGGASVDQSVVSHGQSGGITAHTVNLAPQPRVLDEYGKRMLLTKVPRNYVVKINCPFGDTEAFDFAKQIKDFLIDNGFQIASGGISRSIRQPPAESGVTILGHIPSSEAEIIVGPR